MSTTLDVSPPATSGSGRSERAGRRGRLRRALEIAGVLGALLAVALAYLHLAVAPVYEFPASTPFRGDHWHNPYAALSDARDDDRWLRGVFHLHSEAWGGLTNGTCTVDSLASTYAARAYDIVGISNYMSIREPLQGETVYLSCYEHGFGMSKQHQTVIGAPRVDWFDFPILHLTRNTQFIFDRLRDQGAVVVMNHPWMGLGYRQAQMAALTGYTGVEIASSRGQSVAHWDAALSAGRAVWGFCSDDKHRVSPNSLAPRTAGWVVIRAASEPGAVLAALRSGRFYSAWRSRREDDPSVRLVAVDVDESLLRVALSEPVDGFRFVGQGGRVLATATGGARAEYRLTATDTYVRVEAMAGASTLYLNPVLRSEDPSSAPTPVATVAPVPTWSLRIGFGVAGLWIAVVLLRFTFRSRAGRGSRSAS